MVRFSVVIYFTFVTFRERPRTPRGRYYYSRWRHVGVRGNKCICSYYVVSLTQQTRAYKIEKKKNTTALVLLFFFLRRIIFYQAHTRRRITTTDIVGNKNKTLILRMDCGEITNSRRPSREKLNKTIKC